MNKWMNEQMNEWTNEWMNEWMNERMNEYVNAENIILMLILCSLKEKKVFWYTVCFIATVTFHDGVAPKVIKIIQFCKKHLEDNTLAFCYQ